jgi:Tfp pilus assembly protein PilO
MTVQPIYKNYITKFALIWAACFAVFVLAYVLLLAPQSQRADEFKREHARIAKQFKLAEDAFTGAAKARYNQEIGKLHEKLDDFAIVETDSSKLLVDIGNIARKLSIADLKIDVKNDQTQTPGTQSIGKTLAANYIYVSFKGSFLQFAKFLNQLERNKPIIFIDKFSITRSDKSNFDNDASMVLAVFVCPQDNGNENALLAGP